MQGLFKDELGAVVARELMDVIKAYGVEPPLQHAVARLFVFDAMSIQERNNVLTYAIEQVSHQISIGQTVKSTCEGNIYERSLSITGRAPVVCDLYAVFKAFPVVDAAVEHALKKMLVTGNRSGGKSWVRDMEDVKWSLSRALELNW